MILRPCPREKEVKELLERGHWCVAAATTPELRAHVNACRACSDLVLVSEAFKRARAEAAGAANIAAPGVLWWRAQLRRRQTAIERIGKPLLGAQIFALCVLLVLAVGFLVTQARQGLEWLTRLEHLPQAGALRLEDLWSSAFFTSAWSPLVLIPALATLILLAGVVVYLAAEKQ
ncbi:MAG: hypothetical protein KGL37_07585 [Acidobacteriota bacterium]|nr:hypothetical protein [Acidobacteriota bacterium]